MSHLDPASDQHHPPGYSEMDETRRTAFLPGSPEWQASQQQQQQQGNGASIVDHYYDSTGSGRDNGTYAQHDNYAAQIDDMFMQLDSTSPGLEREVYATEYIGATPELDVAQPQRHYLTEGGDGLLRTNTYATEYSRYLDDQGAGELDMPQYHLYNDEKSSHRDVARFRNSHATNTYDNGYSDVDYNGYSKEDRYRGHEGNGDEDMDSDSDDSGDDDEEEEGENSPIEIVAMTVSTFDDPTLPCLTFRFWVMGTFFTVLGAATSLVFYFRPTPFQFSVFFVQLASYPLGVLMAKTLPRKKYSLFGKYFYLNPGPFNMKEHMLIAVAVNTGGSVAYAIDVLAIQRLYYQMDVGALNAIVLLITTQCIGYGMAGFLRNILIKPANMVWPSMLVQVALYNTLHAAESVSRNFNRQRFFFIVFCCAFLYNFLPGYIAPALSSVALLCMTLPNSPVAQVLGSGIRGMGLLNVSLDWTMVGAFGPLYTPWWAQLNFYVGVIIAVWVVAPSLYLTNTMNAQLYEPVMVTQYDEEANEYDINRILRDNYEVDEAKLNAYSGLRMSPYIVFLYFMALAAVASTLMHVFLYYRHTIYRQFRASRKEKEDVHSRMMRAYPEVPVSWYIGIFVAMLVAAIVVCEMSSIRLPWWAVLVAVTIAGFMSLPMGIIQAISNNRVGLNVLSELVGGYMLPGKPIANATFKAFGYMTMFQCLLLVEDLKLGHYMKIPPRKLFVVQVWGTVVGALVNYGLFEWMLWMKGDVLTGKVPDPTGQWATRNSQTYFAASLIWGAYGPHRMFGPESPYRIVLWGFLVGILLPIPFYFLHKRFPGGKWHLVNIPILATGMHVVPLAPPTFIMSSFIIAFVFQYFIYRRHHGWWKRNTYILSAALDAGTQVSTLFIVFGLSTVAFPGWFGNNNNSGNIERCNVDMMRDAADL